MMWSCEKCGVLNDDAAAVCAQCGAPSPNAKAASPPDPAIDSTKMPEPVAPPEPLVFPSAPQPNAAPAPSAPSPAPPPRQAAPVFTPPPSAMPPPQPTAWQSQTMPPPPTMAPGAQQIPQSDSNIPSARPGELATLGRAINIAWEAIREQMGTAIIATLIFYIMNAILGNIPVINMLAAFLVLPHLTGGMVILCLNLINRRNAEVGQVFSGFSNYGAWLLLYLLWMVVGLAVAIPVAIPFLIGMAATGGFESSPDLAPGLIGGIAVGGIISAILYFMAMTRWIFSYALVAEGYGVIEAFTESARITEGMRWNVLGVTIVLSLLASVGVLGCCVGVLFTYPLALCAGLVYYNDLKVLNGRRN